MQTKSQNFASKLINSSLSKIEKVHNTLIASIPEKEVLNINWKNKIISIDNSLKSYSPLTIIAFIILIKLFFDILGIVLGRIKKFFKQFKSPKDFAYAFLLKLPSAKKELAEANEKAKKEFESAFGVNKFKKMEFRDNGQDKHKVLAMLEQVCKTDDQMANTERLTGAVYCQDSEIRRIANEAANIFSYTNLIHPAIYIGGRFIEAQLIKIGIDLFHGKKDACGLTTAGGTLSLLTAMFVYRKRGEKLGIEEPNIIIPETAHAAFDKAGDMFKIKMIKIPLDKNYQIDLSKVKRAINKNTVAIVGSFPNFPHCVADDIEGLSNIAVKYKVPLHVDCCLGGFLVAFFEKGNIKIPKFDFRLPGVTSISADLHKYGLCPKGISLLLFANHELRRNAYFIYPHWQGGLYCSPHFDGSRTGALVAASYAVLISLGKNVYVNISKQIHECVKKVKKVIDEELDLIQVIGQPFICGVAFKGEQIEHFYDEMSHRGWNLNFLYRPKGLNFIFTSANMKNVDQFIKDLRECHKIIKEGKCGKLSEVAQLYGMTLPMPERAVRGSLDILVDTMLD